MRIFVAGATGLIGRRAVAALVAAGHEVTGVARSDEKAALLARLGARAARVDLFDGPGLVEAVAGHQAVVNLATHIPRVAQAAKPSAWAENDRIRREASGLLVDAALAAGAELFVQESLAFFYADGGARWLDEDTPLVDNDITDAVQIAEGNVRRFAAGGGRGVVLRFGRFYTADSEYTRKQLALARWGVSFEIGAADGYQPLIDVDDAAAAVLRALDAPSGVYNVVDDEPMTRRQIDGAVAELVGRNRLRRFDRLTARTPASALADRSNRVSNRRFVSTTGWSPRSRSGRDGLATVAGQLAREARLPAVVLVSLAVLALSGLSVGIQALFFPESFYESFPFGRGWVALDPPYNEHLIRDVGGLQLGLGIVASWAYLTRRRVLTRAAGLGWLAFSVPHAVFHLNHLDAATGADTVGIVVGTVGPALLALLVIAWPLRPSESRTGDRATGEVIDLQEPVSAGVSAGVG